MLQLIGLFRQNNWNITFASAAAESPFMTDLSEYGVEKVGVEMNNESFDAFVRSLQPNAVLFDRFMTEEQFGWRVAETCPQALRILDTEDLHCLRAARMKAFKENRTYHPSDLFREDIAKREIASIFRCDLSLIISTYEMEVLQKQFKIDPALLHYISFLLEPMEAPELQELPAFDERQHFISIGNFLHAPNKDAVLYLKEMIWPLIRKQLPQAELHVYGAYASQQINELHKPSEGFHCMGRAVDARSVIAKAKVLLAPLRFGAGIKGKLTDAMQCGTPSITTSIGAEGMHGNLNWSGIIADGAIDFANAAIQLYTDKMLWQQSQQNGIKIINTIFAKAQGQQLITRITELQQNAEQQRLQNFTGAMLMHHTVSGTKYMSKWIEEKAKGISQKGNKND